ncbi:MAG TPA: glycosyltransferase family 4 protein [Candidatus Cryptobacteroides intestinipullorum]|nr:glycosyltransferase family 4 protein [Candidatus Cryptobacteroides intestinipullorum]
MVVFDCERMKYPNTGLAVFCNNIAENLVKQRMSVHDRLEFFVPSRYRGLWGEEVLYRPVHALDQVYLHCNSNVRVWHSAFQQTSFMPPARVKVVLTVHDLNFLYDKPLRKHRKYLSVIQKNLDRADHIVAVSESTKRDLLDNLNMRGKYVEVVYNGLNHFDGDMVPPVSRPKGKFLFSVGSVVPKKNFHVLPVLLRDNDYQLIIAGNRSPYENRIMEEADKYGVRDRVHITGPVTDPVKYWYIKNCSAFLFPSVAEGFGLPVIEAMYYQKPIFLSDRTSLPEIGGSYAFYFDHNFDPDIMTAQFRKGMEEFAGGAKDLEDMKKHALSFSWERTARRYIDIYNELM